MNNKISVIVPVYNVELFLSDCIESILNQTYKHLEIIIIDDGSTDSSSKICDNYALTDNRIRVIHQKNGGLSEARNVGLEYATGDVISFVDSDDLLHVDFYQKLLPILIENNLDIIECGYKKFTENSDIEIKFSNTKIEIFNTLASLELLMKEYFKQTVWNKIYRKEVLQNITFPVRKLHEDEYWTYKVFGNSKKIGKVSYVLHFYRQQSDSIMGKRYSLDRLDGLAALAERIDYMKENFPALENLAVKIFCLASLWHYQKIDQYLEIDPIGIYRKRLVKSIKIYNKPKIFKQWNAKEILWYQFFITVPHICVKFRNFIKIGI